MNQTTLRLSFLLAAGCVLFVSVQAGSLEPPPGPVSPTRPPDRCFDNTANRFVDCGDGTIKDTETGLFWLKDASCFGTMNWAAASIAAADLAHGMLERGRSVLRGAVALLRVVDDLRQQSGPRVVREPDQRLRHP